MNRNDMEGDEHWQQQEMGDGGGEGFGNGQKMLNLDHKNIIGDSPSQQN